MSKTIHDRFTIGEASKYLGVSIQTLRRWDNARKIISYRSPGGHRYFLRSDIKEIFKKQHRKRKNKSLPKKTTNQEILTAQVSQTHLAPLKDSKNPTSAGFVDIEAKKRIIKLPIRRIFLILLAFFVAMDITLLAVYLSMANLAFLLP